MVYYKSNKIITCVTIKTSDKFVKYKVILFTKQKNFYF